MGTALALTPLSAAAPLLGWLSAAAVFVTWTWMEIWPLDGAATALDARSEDPSRPVADAACTLAAICSLVAIGVVLVEAGGAKGAAKTLEIFLAIASVTVSWLLIHTVFTLRYARQWYASRRTAVDFNTDEPPTYSDFAYLAFTIGLTFQVSDTDVRTREMRKLALRHMLLSYLMGAVIIALMINLVAGLTK